MKPLTIEELKALEVGDWVWIENKSLPSYSGYYKIIASAGDMYILSQIYKNETFRFSDYGKTWLSYKNKEQAECKGEIVELPCIVNTPPFWYVLSDEFVGEVILYKYDTREQAERRLAELKGEKIQE